ncbi:MAG: two-component response regulator [Rhodospirillales bacterium]|nr:two-component response regulator [Rhodospirillales bacterium]
MTNLAITHTPQGSVGVSCRAALQRDETHQKTAWLTANGFVSPPRRDSRPQIAKTRELINSFVAAVFRCDPSIATDTVVEARHEAGGLSASIVARIEALLYRPTDYRATILRVGPLELDLIERTARRGARRLDLLPREFRLLEYLVRHEGQIVTRAMLFSDVWNYRFMPDSNLVDVHMGRLRRKVDHTNEPQMIQPVRGAGFVLRAPVT